MYARLQIGENLNSFYDWLKSLPKLNRKRGNQGTKKRSYYKDLVCAFDIETTTIDEIEQSFMYIWQWQFGEEYTIIGRTWEEFIIFCETIKAELDGLYICSYIHNASYEFQFLRGIYKFKPEEVFAIESRKILKFTMWDAFEFRCSYLHSNMSLKMYTDKMNVKHKKLDDFIYTEKRYSWTKLTERELEYCVNDVRGLVEAIETEMAFDGDNLYTIPLTSTGYVRRDAKKALKQVSHTFVSRQLPDYNLYCLLREAFRGGNTHANRWYSGLIVDNVKSADRSSSYPDVQINCKFPVTPFFHVGKCSVDDLVRFIDIRGKAVVMRIAYSNIRLVDEYYPVPYLAKDKCRMVKNADYDNGRILAADYLETTITDIDFRIIIDQYQFDDVIPLDVYKAGYGDLPKPLKEMIIDYYKKKTELKDVSGQEMLYMKSKNKLNSIYGMSAQDPVKQSILFENDDFILDESKTEQQLLEESNHRAFMPYQWGVWTTAWARYRLEEGIRLAGDSFVYCDTDSVKYTSDIDWGNYNSIRETDSKTNGSYAIDPKGVTHFMGVYEFEGVYEKFSTLGAKKYVYQEGDNLHCTIAGVSKAEGGKELQKHGGIEAFKEGFIFVDAGGTKSIYNDDPTIKEWIVDDKKINITSNVVIKDSTYTLGITEEYRRLLERCSLGFD